jgi:nucleotide-binding universal stress UspA family protein
MERTSMTRRIVVGVDGSEGSKRALEWAAREARLRAAPLEIVLVWRPSVSIYAGAGWPVVDDEMFEGLLERARERLERTCASVAPALDGLEVERTVVEGPAARTLMDAAVGADLLVVGTRGHGGFAGLLLGSVSAQCAHHSPCPVVIVPHPTPEG